MWRRGMTGMGELGICCLTDGEGEGEEKKFNFFQNLA
jgi:hypothetical protein